MAESGKNSSAAGGEWCRGGLSLSDSLFRVHVCVSLHVIRLRGCRRGESERKDRGHFSTRAEARTAELFRAEKHGRESDEQDHAQHREYPFERERDEHGLHLLRCGHRAVPSETHRAPFPLGHTGAGLDAGFGIIGEIPIGSGVVVGTNQVINETQILRGVAHGETTAPLIVSSRTTRWKSHAASFEKFFRIDSLLV